MNEWMNERANEQKSKNQFKLVINNKVNGFYQRFIWQTHILQLILFFLSFFKARVLKKMAMLIFHMYTPRSKQLAASKYIIKTYFSYVHWTKTYLISSFKSLVRVPNTFVEYVTESKPATNEEDADVSAWDAVAVTAVTKLHRTIKWTIIQSKMKRKS